MGCLATFPRRTSAYDYVQLYGNRRNDRKIVFRADDGDGGDDDDGRISASPAREHMVVEKYNAITAVKGWLLLAKQLCSVRVRVDKPSAGTPVVFYFRR